MLIYILLGILIGVLFVSQLVLIAHTFTIIKLLSLLLSKENYR